ncbi:MAG TPA: hypothetical protein VK709_12915 [Candidatus Saccharimonadales bacterium]|nr:hypothetical protein [Candidatus Saccharimonadales bacterium]
MFSDSAQETRKGLRVYIVVSIVAFLVVGVYIGWVFYSRWSANRAIADKAAEKARTQDQKTFDLMGGDRFEILVYAANPPEIRAGEKSSLCYSVSNAKEVKIEPNTEEPVWPAYSRCVHVSPRKSTKYTLTIDDGAGHTKTAAVDVKVR